MNIYIIPAWYPENESDITASFIREQVHALSKRGHSISVLVIKVFSVREIKEYLKYKERTWDDGGIKTKFYKVLAFAPIRVENAHHNKVASKYYKIISKTITEDLKHGNTKPDLIHSHVGPWCSYFVIPAAKKLGLPIITTEHYSGLTNGKSDDLKFVREKYVVENSDLTIFVGTNLQNNVLRVTGASGNTIVIPNQINPEIFKNVSADNDNKVFRFITACHLVPLKKVELVIQAFHEEFSRSEKVEYLIAGDGPMRQQLESLTKELEETDRIHFFGRYSREEMPSLFSECNAFVLISEYETFGIVYIEAMMCGLPCIGTKGQGSDDIIDESNGISVEYGNISQLRKAMRYVFKNKSRYISQVITDKTINKFSDDTICSRLEEEYKKILNKY